MKLLPLGGYEQGFVIFSGQILFRKHDDSLQASSPFVGAGGGGGGGGRNNATAWCLLPCSPGASLSSP